MKWKWRKSSAESLKDLFLQLFLVGLVVSNFRYFINRALLSVGAVSVLRAILLFASVSQPMTTSSSLLKLFIVLVLAHGVDLFWHVHSMGGTDSANRYNILEVHAG